MKATLWETTGFMAFQEQKEPVSDGHKLVDESGRKTNLLADLKACSRTKDLEAGKQLHEEAIRCGYDSSNYVASALINMYAKCGSMTCARQVYDSVKDPNVVSWTALIMGYAECGEGLSALDLFTRMESDGTAPNSVTFVAALKACTSLTVNRVAEGRVRGKEVHKLAVEKGFESDIYVQSTLIDMYVKSGSVVEARQVFDDAEHPNVVSWTALIMGYAEAGEGLTALSLFTRMQSRGPAPNSVTFIAALKACTSVPMLGETIQYLEQGRAIHKLAVEGGCSLDKQFQNTLLDMYGKSGCVTDALRVFDNMNNPDVVSWNALILGYADAGQGLHALYLFTRMESRGSLPNSATFVALLKACTSITIGKPNHWIGAIHNHSGSNLDLYTKSALIDMYAKSGFMSYARRMFDSMDHPDVVAWNALILGYAECGQGQAGLEMFTRLIADGPAPSSVTFVAALKASASVAGSGREECRNRGRAIHKLAVVEGWDTDAYVQSCLVDMYSKCRCMVDARKVFDCMKRSNVVSWTSLILGYAEAGEALTSLDVFSSMASRGLEPNSVTFVAALKACITLASNGDNGKAECLKQGKAIHYRAVDRGCDSDVYVQSTLIDMYAKCSSMGDAHQVFDSMKFRDVVSWTTLIVGYVNNGQGEAALDLFARMRTEGPPPDAQTYSGALRACSLLGALDFGRRIHSEVDTVMKDLDVVLVTCLVDFYSKCGSMLEAQSVFDLHAGKRDMVTWNALLAGYSSCGDYECVFRLFEGMQDAGFQPDAVTFLCILTCCSHAGLVERGKEYFDMMSTKHGITPAVEHCNCMIDILGRANKLDDALAMLERMPCSPNEVTWMTILGACGKWKNVEIGRLAFQRLTNLNHKDPAGYVLMEQIYESRGMLQEQEVVMGIRRQLREV